MTKREVRKNSIAHLEDMRRAGIKFVEIMGCNKIKDNKKDDCEVCLDLKGCKMEIELAVPLPLPGCDKKHCKCLWLARE